MIPKTTPLNEINSEKLEESFVLKDQFIIYKNVEATFKNYYIYYPVVDKSIYIGPFFTRSGAIKYAFNLKLDVDFGSYK